MIPRLLAVLLLLVSARAEILVQEKVSRLPFPHQGPFVRTADGVIWGMDDRGALLSRNEGRNWIRKEIFDTSRFVPSAERALLRTREGVLLYAFLNRQELVFKWDERQGGPLEGCRLPVYVMRSADDGATWERPVLLQEGWCGAVRQMIQLRSGRVVLVAQRALAHPGRHATVTYTTDDAGQSWQEGGMIDLGAEGNYRDPVTGLNASTHGGAIEGTVLERGSGDLLMLLRVPHGCFYVAVSKDGRQWSRPFPAPIEASDSPGMMVRLASGRVALVWNRFRDPVKRAGRRELLSLAFSENDGVTWTTPQIVAAHPAVLGRKESYSWVAYPYVFEPAPGRLWISTMQGGLSVALDERDFLAPPERPLEGPSVRVLTLGDSITRAARPGVAPGEGLAARLQAALRAEGMPAQVHNLGIGGERTDQALQRLERDVLSQRPHVVTIMYGTNDSWVDPGKSASRLREEEYESNLRAIVRQLRAAGAQVVLMTPPKFAEKNPRNGLGEDPNLRLAGYAERCRRVARDTGVPLVDHFLAWESAQRQGRTLQEWTTDGCHPNAAGHADLTARLTPVVVPLARNFSTRP